MNLRKLGLMAALLLLAAITISGCVPTAAKPSVVIISPASGSQFREGEEVAIQSTASDSAGVTRVELVVDNVTARIDPSPSPQGQPSLTLIQTWKAVPGSHTITVRAYNAAGAVSDPVAILLTVSPAGTGAASPTPMAQASPGSTVIVITATPGPPTPVPPTAVPPPTGVPPTAVPPTAVPPPPPPPGCSGSPIISSFTGSPTTINLGNSSTLSWGAVTNADSVDIDNGIGGVATPGSTSVSPPATTTYKMTAHCGSNTSQLQVTITVNVPPPPPQVPAAPSAFNANGTGTTIQFTWTDNSTNETGFRIYQDGVAAPVVTVGAHTGTGGMSYSWGGRPCNMNANFRVRAYNSAGESSPSSPNSAVTIPCAPTGFNAVGGVSQTIVSVSFTDTATNESGFHIYRTGSSTVLATLSAHPTTGAKGGTVGSIPCGTAYNYYARAYNSAGESSPSNSNDATTAGCTVTVNFTGVHVYDDEDPTGTGELWFDFNVNGQIRRYPASDTIDIGSGGDKTITGTSVTLTLLRTTNLVISVHGTDKDFPPLDQNDSLGTASATYTGSANWSEGSHCTESASPHDFRICYSITVTP